MSILVISGFSGVGKGTITKKLLSDYPEEYFLSVSATTRAPRAGEVNGREYFFISEEKFRELVRQDSFLEYAEYSGNFYGTLKDFRKFANRDLRDKNIIFEIDIRGGFRVKEAFPDAKLIFIVPPTASDLVTRLKGRQSESDAQIKKRLERAVEETDFINRYEYVVVNDSPERATEEIHRINERPANTKEEKEEIRKAMRESLTNLKGGIL